MSVIPWLIAIPVTAFVMGGWRRLFRVIFKKRSRELSARMLRLTAAARFMVWHAAIETYGDTQDQERADKHAGDIVRYLFNDPESEKDKADPFWAATKIEAMLWLDANAGWRELVVQSLKVQMIATSGMGENDPDDLNKLINAPVFKKYQGDYPMKVDPQSYTALVNGKIEELPEATRAMIRQRFHV